MPFVQESLQKLLVIDSVCELFEADCETGVTPNIEVYLAKVADVQRADLLRELICLECEHRVRKGQRPTREEYERRFPQYQSVVEEALNRILLSAVIHVSPGQVETSELYGAGEQADAATLLLQSQVAPSPCPPLLHPTLGRLEIRALSGKGGFGAVYRAWDPLLRREVAVKILHQPAEGSKPASQQLLHEARTLVRLRHPNIVAVHDADETTNGECFVVMDFIDGPTLQQVLRDRKKLPLEETIELVAKIAEAIAEAHRQRIFHRDLKPANILLDASGEPYIVDFGLALDEATQRQRRGEASGTLPYMAPEQLRGDAHLLDGRADIWSLGVILYELLVGKRPFGGNTVNQTTEEILRKPPTPVRQIDSGLPAGIDRILQRALAKDPAQRYATAQDLATDLRRTVRPTKSIWMESAAVAIVAGTIFFGAAAMIAPRPPVEPVGRTKFEPTLDIMHYEDENSERLLGRNPDTVLHKQVVQLEIKNPDPVHIYVFLLDETGLVTLQYPERDAGFGDSDKHRELKLPLQSNSGSNQYIPVGGDAGRDYYFVGVSDRTLTAEQLGQLDGQRFRLDRDRAAGRPVSALGPPSVQLQATLEDMRQSGILKKYSGRGFYHLPPGP